VIFPGTLVMACRPETAAGACVSRGRLGPADVVVVVVGAVVVCGGGDVVDDGGGGGPPVVGGGGGGLDPSAAPAPAQINAAAMHAAASARSPKPDLTIPSPLRLSKPEL
jgi:hypothetical protein